MESQARSEGGKRVEARMVYAETSFFVRGTTEL